MNPLKQNLQSKTSPSPHDEKSSTQRIFPMNLEGIFKYILIIPPHKQEAPLAYRKISYAPSHLVLGNLVLREVNLKWMVPFIGHLFLCQKRTVIEPWMDM